MSFHLGIVQPTSPSFICNFKRKFDKNKDKSLINEGSNCHSTYIFIELYCKCCSFIIKFDKKEQLLNHIVIIPSCRFGEYRTIKNILGLLKYI